MSDSSDESQLSYFTGSKNVTELSPRDFDGAATWKLKNKKCVAVLFYAPWCPWCKKVKDAWEELGKHAMFMDVCAMDCEKYKAHILKIKEDMPGLIKAYPTIAYYHNGSPEEIHNGERDYKSLLVGGMKACKVAHNK